MIELRLYNKKTKLKDADYVLDEPKVFYELLNLITPKDKGKWLFYLLDWKIVNVRELIDNDNLPDYVDIVFYLPQVKLDTVVTAYPKYAPRERSNKDIYKEMITGLKHLIDKNAMWTLYNSFSGNLNQLQDALTQLDNECEGTTITVKQLQSTFALTKRVYASDVLLAFLTKDRYRWYKLNQLTKELGDEIAYYAIYKQVRKLLNDKAKYLVNEDTKNRNVERIDAPLICYTYTLFANSSSYHNLFAIMYSLDNRCKSIMNINMNMEE
jgi:DNA polymerase III delta subunit